MEAIKENDWEGKNYYSTPCTFVKTGVETQRQLFHLFFHQLYVSKSHHDNLHSNNNNLSSIANKYLHELMNKYNNNKHRQNIWRSSGIHGGSPAGRNVLSTTYLVHIIL